MKKDAKDVNEKIGARIKLQRELCGMSNNKLAKMIGVSHVQMQKYEKGENRPSTEKLKAIGYVLGCSVEFLAEGGEKTNSDHAIEKALRLVKVEFSEGDKKRILEYINLLNIRRHVDHGSELAKRDLN